MATINDRSLELVLGDITHEQLDAIVNAANSRLAGGGGVDGAIHRAGGPTIMAETASRYPDGCPTGAAVITGAGNLNAKYVIHAVGPFWSGGDRGEAAMLEAAYRSALQLAADHECESVALPALSTGAYRYPPDEAADIAVRAASEFLRGLPQTHPIKVVRFCLFSSDILNAFQRAFESETSAQ